MNMRKLWECIKVNHKEFVVFMKYGNFYKVFGDDIYVIWKVTGYKVIDDDHIGFPVKSINSVLKKLELIGISYVIYDKSDDYLSVSVVDNNYLSFMNDSRCEYLYNVRVRNIVNCFESVIRNDIEKLEYYEEEFK